MKKYEVRITRLTVLPSDDVTYSEMATNVSIEDESAGEFVKIEQCVRQEQHAAILLNPEEWPTLKDAVDRMILECRPRLQQP